MLNSKKKYTGKKWTKDQWKEYQSRKSRKEAVNKHMNSYVSTLLDAGGMLECFSDDNEYEEPIQTNIIKKSASMEIAEPHTEDDVEEDVNLYQEEQTIENTNRTTLSGHLMDQMIKENYTKEEKIDDVNFKRIYVKGVTIPLWSNMKGVQNEIGEFKIKYSNKGFATVPTMNKFITMANKTPKPMYHEICYDNVKMYADLENYEMTDVEMMNRFTFLLRDVFCMLRHKYKFDDKQFTFTVCNSTDKKSMHFILNNGYVFNMNRFDTNDPDRSTTNSQYEFWQFVKHVVETNEKYNYFYYTDKTTHERKCSIDWGVWTRNKNMRCMGSTKDNDSTGRIHLPFKCVAGDKIVWYKGIPKLSKKYLINDPHNKQVYIFGYPDYKKVREIKPVKYDGKNIRERIENALPDMIIQNERNGFFEMRNNGSRTCLHSGDEHIHNHGYCVIRSSGLYFHCLAQNCEPMDDNRLYIKNKGVLIHAFQKFSVLKTLNAPVHEDNYRAKIQRQNDDYKTDDIYFSSYCELVDVTTTAKFDDEGKLLEDQEKEGHVYLSEESQANMLEWAKKTIKFIDNSGDPYFMVKERDYNHKALLVGQHWVRRQKNTLIRNDIPLSSKRIEKFNKYYPKASLNNIGDFIKWCFLQGKIKKHHKCKWFPFDDRRPPNIPHVFNTFSGFPGDKLVKQRNEQMLNPEVKNSKDSDEYRELEKKAHDKQEDILDAELEIRTIFTEKFEQQMIDLRGEWDSYLDEQNDEEDEISQDIEERIELAKAEYEDFILDYQNALDLKVNDEAILMDVKIKLREFDRKDDSKMLGANMNKRFEKSKMYHHMKTILCDGDEKLLQYLLKWVAHIFQYPAEKPPVCLIFYSMQGAGKDLFFGWLGKLLSSENYIMCGNIQRFTEKFNVLYSNKLLTCFNELGSHEEQGKIAKFLKYLFSTEDKAVECKGHDPTMEMCFARHAILTNMFNPLPMEISDRRMVCIKCNNSRCKHTPENRKYFNDIVAETKDIDALIDAHEYFKHLDLSNFEVRDIPMTNYKRELIELHYNTVQQFIVDLQHIEDLDGKLSQDTKKYRRFCNKNIELEDGVLETHQYDYEFKGADMFRVYNDFCKEQNIKDQYIKIKKTFLAEIKNNGFISKTITPSCRSYYNDETKNQTRFKGYMLSNALLQDAIKTKLNGIIPKDE